jgi:phage-related baseplate assembly protein
MIDFITINPDDLLKEAVARYEAVSGETLYPGDEHYLFLSQMLQLIVACKGDINSAANQNLLRYCTEDILNEYGSQYDVIRMAAKSASASMKFMLPAALGFDVTILSGTRVTPDGRLVFYLQADVIIAAGQISAQGTILAENPGAAYNGFLPGQIQSIIDPVDYIGSASNVTVSSGGADQEDDDSFRERIRLSWEAISTAGSKDSYEYWAKTASSDIVDAEAVRTSPGEVTIYILMSGASAPAQTILDAVIAACSAEKHRPLTDKVVAAAAQVKAYDVNLTYYVSNSRSTEVLLIQSAVNKAVNDFVTVQKRQLGGNLNPDSLRSALLMAGAYRIDMTSPTYTELQPQEVAVANTISVVYGGLL